ncbi:MAG: hypothetical protein K0R67_3557 [Paenibacillus sp.]|nr:hypothetical protein [Paenibacillus sp.]
MKSILSQGQLRIVGKGWEVQQYLHKLTYELDGGHVALTSLVSSLTGYIERGGLQSGLNRSQR